MASPLTASLTRAGVSPNWISGERGKEGRREGERNGEFTNMLPSISFLLSLFIVFKFKCVFFFYLSSSFSTRLHPVPLHLVFSTSCHHLFPSFPPLSLSLIPLFQTTPVTLRLLVPTSLSLSHLLAPSSLFTLLSFLLLSLSLLCLPSDSFISPPISPHTCLPLSLPPLSLSPSLSLLFIS